MAAEKVTVMVLKVDLQCSSCYKKTKRTLCKFPQIRDQIYNEKANTVTVRVVCCSPERIRDKLCCKGGKAIKSIEILESPKPDNKPKEPDNKPKDPEKPKQAEKPKEPEKPKQADKPKEPEKAKAPEKKVTIQEPKDAGKPKEGKPKDAGNVKPKEGGGGGGGGDKPKSNMKPSSDGGPPPQAEKPKDGPKPEPAKNPGMMMMNPIPVQQAKGPEPVMAQGVPSVFPYVGPSYDAGPYYQGYGYPVPPPQPMYEGYYGHGQDQYGGYGYGYGGRVAHVNRSDSYVTEEEPGCSIM